MRDGVHLHTVVFAPEGVLGAWPIILVRTPYDCNQWGIGPGFEYFKAIAQEGYLFAIQDVRGRFHSEGKFVMMRPPRSRSTEVPRPTIDEGTDAYDTIDWLVKHIPGNNGRVGMLGVSYDGWLAAMALTEPHPALKAVSPQAPPADMFLGDDFHHNGAFRLSYGFEYAAMMETDRSQNFSFAFDKHDTYDWYLNLGPLANVNSRYLHNNLPTWNDFVAHPDYDAFWQGQSAAPYLSTLSARWKASRPATMFVAGWWDQEDFYGPLAIHRALTHPVLFHEKKDFLVVGPWNHGGWGHGEGRRLGNIDFGSATASYYRDKIQAPWFAHFLKDRPLTDQPPVLVFESGTNRWVGYDSWPPERGVRTRDLYFRPNGKLGFDPPHNKETLTQESNVANREAEFDSYLSDPAHPVPYRPRPIEATYAPTGSGWYTWLLEDQRFVANRPDVLMWQTEPLTSDVTLAGDISAHLFASTTGSDSDWIVKLIDVYPDIDSVDLLDKKSDKKSDGKSDKKSDGKSDGKQEGKQEGKSTGGREVDPKMLGYQLMVANEVLRGRFRKGFERSVAIPPNRVEAYTVDLHSQAYCFRKGHRIMVQVQSSWFPLIDRNPQTFVPNIFNARPQDFRPATQRIYHTPRYASHVTVTIRE